MLHSLRETDLDRDLNSLSLLDSLRQTTLTTIKTRYLKITHRSLTQTQTECFGNRMCVLAEAYLPLIFISVHAHRYLSNVVEMRGMLCGNHTHLHLTNTKEITDIKTHTIRINSITNQGSFL